MIYHYNPADKENYPSMAWLGVLSICVFWSSFEAPLTFALGFKIEEHNLWWDALFSVLFCTDIILKLTKKLKLPENKDLEDMYMDKPNKYFNTPWFYVDIICSLPFDIITYGLIHALGPVAVPLNALRLLKLVRITKLRPYLLIADFLPKATKVLLVMGGVVLALHLISCGWMLIHPRSAVDDLTFYTISLYWSITTLTTVGYGDITPTTNLARLYTMGVMLIGVGVYGVIIGNFSRMMMLADKYTEERKEKMNNLHQFMRYYNIPASLQRQVFSFYNHILKKNLSEEDSQIIKDLPQALQNELNIFMKIKLIRNVHIFHEASTPCLKMIAEKLEQTFHSPGEYIIKKGDVGDEMFIIGHGEVNVSIGDKVLAELKAGQFFGEIALLEDTIRTTDVRTKSYCDLYTFKKEDFLEVIQKYPTLGDKFRTVLKRREQDTEAKVHNKAA